jgi:hypothetical protein
LVISNPRNSSGSISDTRNRTAAKDPEINATKLAISHTYGNPYLEICAVFSLGN